MTDAPTSVLLIEDDISHRQLVAAFLPDSDYVVHTAATLFDGLEILAIEKVDVIVLDLNLPDCDGLDGLRLTIRSCTQPVIVYSGTDSPRAARESRLLGAAGFVSKDAPPSEVKDAIDRLGAGEAPWTPKQPATNDLLIPTEPMKVHVERTLAFLTDALPMGRWMFTRVSGEDWIVLASAGEEYVDLVPGTVTEWSRSYCSRMVAGEKRVVADTTADLTYATAPINEQLEIGAYCAAPIRVPRWGLFGTLCGISTRPADLDADDARRLVTFAADSLGTALASDLERDHLERRFALAQAATRLDALTGLANRRALEMMLPVEQARARRYGHLVAIAIIDLDGLKAINDGQGHAAGDAYLVGAADALNTVTRDSDMAFRLGGDEMGLLAPNFDVRKLQALRERLEAALAGHGVRASVGVACQATPTEPLTDVLGRADIAMYQIKTSRRSVGRAEPTRQ